MASEPPPPPDRSTERLAPAHPVAAERVIETRPVADAALYSAVRSLRTALTMVGLLAAAALAVAIYALIETQDSDSSRRAASQERVARLDDRVDRLSRQLQSARASNSGDAEESQLRALETRLNEAATKEDLARLQSSTSEGADPEALDALGQRVDRLAQQVQQLRDSAAQSP